MQWKFEILAFASCLALLATIVALLIGYNHRSPIHSWHGVSLNTIVAALSTADRALLIYIVAEAIGQWKWIFYARTSRPLLDLNLLDNASRGPLGSVKVLGPSSRASWWRIGAAVTVLALMIDPFTQQLVQLESYQKSLQNSAATITRAQRYSRGVRRLIFAKANTPGVHVDTDFTMQSAVLYGLAQPSDTVSKQATFTCDAGNCTWPVFESLAVCSSCNDLRESVVNYTDINWGDWRLGDVADDGSGLMLSWNATTFQMPNGHVLNNLNGYLNDSTSLATVMTTFGTGNATKTSSFKDNDSLIWAMSFLAIPPSMPMSATWPNIPIIAEECALYYCVNNYNASVTSGTLNIEVTQAKAPRSPQSWQFGRAESGWNETATSIASLEFNNITSTPDRTDLEFGDGFNVSQEAVDSISLYFQSQFAISSDLNSSWVPRQNDTSEAVKDELVTLNGFILNQNYFPSALQAFYSSPNLTSRFEALAKSMSNTVQADADNGTVQIGSAYITATRYKIQWEWMALHAVLHITVGMFLWMTIRETKTSGAPLWKSNALAPFLCCTELGNLFDDVASVKVMEQKASQYFVWLGAKSLTEGSDYIEPGSPHASRHSKSPSLSLYPVT